MSALENLRKRSGLIVALVGLALLAFVLTGLFESRFSLMQGTAFVGEINGEKITLEDFEKLLKINTENARERMGGSSLDENMQEMVNNNTWEELIRKLTIDKQIEKSGIVVTQDELTELIIGNEPDPMLNQYFSDPQSGQIHPMFMDPLTGKLSGQKIKEYVDRIPNTPEGQAALNEIKTLEKSVLENRISLKYITMLKKGIYVTTSQAKLEHADKNSTLGFRFVAKRFYTIPDSSVTVTEEEIQNYYNANKNKYKQDASRKLEYLVWDVIPSKEDEEAALTEMNKLAAEFKTTTEDSLFVVNNSEARLFDQNFIKKNQMPIDIDSSFFDAEKGSIFGPYREGKQLKIAKLVETKNTPDSGSTRHILIAYKGASSADPTVVRSREEAEKLADSLKTILKTKGTKNFDELVKLYSSDKGSVEKGGKYEWFKANQMVKPFENAVFNGKKGDITVVETMFGFHLMEVLDVGKTSKKVQIATIDLTINPSTKTKQEYSDKASDFAIKYNTADLFKKGVEELQLNIRTVDPLKESDKQIPGLESPKEMIRWAFNNDKGTVCTDPFSFGNKYVVALISDVREKGIATLEQKRTEVEIGAKMEKKAAMITEEFNKALAGCASLEVFAGKISLNIESIDKTNLGATYVPSVGKEDNLLGTAAAFKKGALSQPIKGQQGVYVIWVDNFTPAPEIKDFTDMKNQTAANYRYKFDSGFLDTLKELAKIEDTRAKYY